MLVPEYPPYLTWGGLGYYNERMVAELQKRGFDFRVLTQTNSGATADMVIEQRGGVTVASVPVPSFVPQDYAARFAHQNVLSLEGATRLVGKHGLVDLLHTQGYFFGLAAPSLTRTIGVPLIWEPTLIYSDRELDSTFTYFTQVENGLAQTAERILCPSEFLASRVRSLFDAPRSKIAIIPRAVDLVNFTIPRAQGRPETKQILYMGRLSYEKGVHVLLEAMPEIVNVYKTIRLVVVGPATDKSYVQGLLKTVKEKNLTKNVVFVGFRSHSELPQIYASSDVVVIPSLSEAYSKVALEAMAAKRPVVASDVGGLTEQITNRETGLSVPPKNSELLAKAVVEVLSDDDLSTELANNGFQHVAEEFTWEKISMLLSSLYNDVSGMSKSTEVN